MMVIATFRRKRLRAGLRNCVLGRKRELAPSRVASLIPRQLPRARNIEQGRLRYSIILRRLSRLWAAWLFRLRAITAITRDHSIARSYRASLPTLADRSIRPSRWNA